MRKPATRYIKVIDNLLEAQKNSQVTKVVIAELVGIEYITLDKYLRKERNICEHEIAKRMVVATDLLNTLVKKKILPIPPETSRRLKSSVILGAIDTYLNPTNEVAHD